MKVMLIRLGAVAHVPLADTTRVESPIARSMSSTVPRRKHSVLRHRYQVTWAIGTGPALVTWPPWAPPKSALPFDPWRGPVGDCTRHRHGVDNRKRPSVPPRWARPHRCLGCRVSCITPLEPADDVSGRARNHGGRFAQGSGVRRHVAVPGVSQNLPGHHCRLGPDVPRRIACPGRDHRVSFDQHSEEHLDIPSDRCPCSHVWMDSGIWRVCTETRRRPFWRGWKRLGTCV